MSHFAKIDDNNVVVEVLVGDNSLPNEGYDWFVKTFGGTWIKTSYSGAIRNKYAAIGDTYNSELDIFISPKPFASWILNETTANWEAPITYPTDDKIYNWDEASLSWKLLENPAE
jgi:hypothetical protein